MRFSCPHCGKALNVKDEYAGKKAKCPGCRNLIRVPAAAPAPAVDYPEEDYPEDDTCPNCEEPLAEGAVLCVNCGYDTRTGKILKTDFGD
jgi:uncharacterized Zn finger protein (UPF0148 family)